MSNKNDFYLSLARAGGAIGKGLIAGFAGTVAITLSQMIEMQITRRGMSNAPVTVGGKTLGVEPRGQAEQAKEEAQSENQEASDEVEDKVETNAGKFGQIMHFSYGTGWGVARGALDLACLSGPPASLIHFGAIWGTALVMLPSTTETPPITKWPPKEIAVDILHHAVYACTAGLVYDAMRKAEKKKKKKANILNSIKTIKEILKP